MCDQILEHRRSPPLLAVVDVGQVHLHDRHLECLERVADRPAVVRPRGRVHDEAVDVAVRVVAPLDVLALVVRVPAAHRAAELVRPLVDLGLQLVDPLAAVQRGVAAAEDVEVDAVQDLEAHRRIIR
jgi:hypothetical protein